jgi:hypothetical protein
VLSGHGGRQAGAGRRCARPGRQACEGSALEPRQRRSTASERGMLEQRRALRQDSDQGTQEDVAHGAIRKPEPVQSRPVRRRNDLQSPTDGRWCVFRALGHRARAARAGGKPQPARAETQKGSSGSGSGSCSILILRASRVALGSSCCETQMSPPGARANNTGPTHSSSGLKSRMP